VQTGFSACGSRHSASGCTASPAAFFPLLLLPLSSFGCPVGIGETTPRCPLTLEGPYLLPASPSSRVGRLSRLRLGLPVRLSPGPLGRITTWKVTLPGWVVTRVLCWVALVGLVLLLAGILGFRASRSRTRLSRSAGSVRRRAGGRVTYSFQSMSQARAGSYMLPNPKGARTSSGNGNWSVRWAERRSPDPAPSSKPSTRRVGDRRSAVTERYREWFLTRGRLRGGCL